MTHHRGRWILVVWLAAASVGIAQSRPRLAARQYSDAVRRAVALLPERPASVLVIDVNDAKPEVREYLWRLQAFILKTSPTIYLTLHGDALNLAGRGSAFHDHVLATVIWHEMAHVDGADETKARRREEALWTRFILENAVERDAGMRYLALLKERPSTESPSEDKVDSSVIEAPRPRPAQAVDLPVSCPRCDALVLRIQGLLPVRPFAVRAVTEGDQVLKRLGHSPEHVDGFVIDGDPVVYLRRQGSTFQLALKGARPAECALAAIVWHEMAHQRGAAETEAQVEEEHLWKLYISMGLVDPERGSKYLDLLVRRHRSK